ncbi:hydantoinase/oxoprolinase family protein [Eoetvoesiella caeni]
MGYRIGIDVGGTFTDYLLLHPDGRTQVHKTLSSRPDPSEAVLRGLEHLASSAGLSLSAFVSEVDIIVHGTTVTTNAVLTGQISRTGLLTTKGFRDALEMRRGVREAFYDNKSAPPATLVPRHLRLPVQGRIDYTGAEIEPLSTEDIEQAIQVFQEAGVEAVAVCFMHAYANAAHEEAAAELIAQRMPDAYLSVSNRVLPQVRYYERTSTTVLNAVVGPILKRYLSSLQRRLVDSGFTGVLRIMQSNGGVSSLDAVAALAASTLLSGPAAAPTAGITAMQPYGEDSFITVDMGGTSFDAALVVGGQPSITTTGTVNRFALALPSMEITTIGAGGGSIAWIDDGLLRMGPQSAGANPGPACYGKGGELPTCSDANLVLGYLSPDFFAGGSIALDVDAASRAISEHISGPLNIDLVRAAYGMHHVMNVNMASAIREISVQKGWDPRKFPLICAGGAGAVHAAMIARELGIRRVIIPREAAIFCASGMLDTDLKHDFVRSYSARLSESNIDQQQVEHLLKSMRDEADTVLSVEGISPQDRHYLYALDLRYLGQYQEVTVGVQLDDLLKARWEDVRDAFHDKHDQLFGYALRESTAVVELVSIRMSALGDTEKPEFVPALVSKVDARAFLKGQRAVYQPDTGTFADTPVYDGDRLEHGNSLSGPAIIEKVTTSIFVPNGFLLTVDALGGYLLEDDANALRKAA